MRAVISSAVLECVGHDVRAALRGMVVWQTSCGPIKTLTDRVLGPLWKSFSRSEILFQLRRVQCTHDHSPQRYES